MKFFLALAPVCLMAQSGITRPQLGDVIDRQGVLRPVFGIAGSFLPDAGKATGALATACSQAVCVAKLKDSIITSDTAIPAPPGPAVIGLEPTGAVIYFAETRQFARLQGGELTALDLTVDGEVLSIRSNSTGIDVAVRREDGIRIVRTDGAVLDVLPIGATSSLLLNAAMVYTTADEFILRRPDGSEQRFSAAGVRDLFVLGDGWVEARSARAIFALRTDPGKEHLYLLPESSAGHERRQ
jgi:hypothetical protein